MPSRERVYYPSAEDLDTRDCRDDFQALLYLVPADESDSGHPEVTLHGGAGTVGIPMPAWHGLWARIGSYRTGAEGESVLRVLEALEHQIVEASDSYQGRRWNGHNQVGQWESDELGTPETLDALSDAWGVESLSIAYAWDAAEYLAGDTDSVADAVLSRIGQRIHDQDAVDAAIELQAESEIQDARSQDAILAPRATQEAIRAIMAQRWRLVVEDSGGHDDTIIAAEGLDDAIAEAQEWIEAGDYPDGVQSVAVRIYQICDEDGGRPEEHRVVILREVA